jgi:hypothetical protein
MVSVLTYSLIQKQFKASFPVPLFVASRLGRDGSLFLKEPFAFPMFYKPVNQKNQ